MPSTKDIVLGDRIFALWKGEPKSGKTVAVGSMPGPMMIFSTDGRIRPLKKMYPDRADIEYEVYTNRDFAKFKRDFERLQDNCPFATICVDGLTTLGDTLLTYMMDLRGGGDVDENGKPIKQKGKKAAGLIPMTDVSDFGGEARGLTQIIDLARTLPAHFILTAHVIEVMQENVVKQTKTVTRSLLTGGKKIAPKIPGLFDEVWHFYKRTSMNVADPPEYHVAFDQVGDDFAGTALPLPMTVEWTMLPGGGGLFPKVQQILREQGIDVPDKPVSLTGSESSDPFAESKG